MRSSHSLMSLLGGAAIGAAAMYLLDPETGEDRRRRLAQAAGETLESAGGHLGDSWNAVSEKASDWASRAGEYGRELAGQASDYAQNLGSSGAKSAEAARDSVGSYASRLAGQAAALARHLSNRARDTGSDWADQAGSAADSARAGLAGIGGRLFDAFRSSARDARDRGSDLADDARGSAGAYLHRAATAMTGQRESSVATPVAVSAITCCAVGAGLMYLFDPDRGQARRNALMRQCQSLLEGTSDLFRTTGQSLRASVSRTASSTADRSRDYLGGAAISAGESPYGSVEQ